MKKQTQVAKKEPAPILNIKEAIDYVKKNSKAKFDATVELHINLNTDPKKTEQAIRFTTVLPNGTGKTVKVASLSSKKVANTDLELSESDISKLESGALKPRVDFDVIVAEPRFMPKLAKAAKVLGPAGVMPNPKNGTVAEDVEKAIESIKKGKVEIRTEPNNPIVHTILGKISFDNKALEENFMEIWNTLQTNKPPKVAPDWIESCFVTSSMGKSAKVDLSLL